MSRTSWKAAELKLARLLGGERVPVSGRQRGWAPDIAHSHLALEVKTRKRAPLLLADGLDQAEKSAVWTKKRGEGERLPMLIIHQDGTRYDNAYVVVRLKDARDYWGIGDNIAPEEVG